MVRYVKNNNGVVTTKQIIEAIDEQTLAVSVCSVEPSSGFRYDLHELGRICKERNVYLVVDATQISFSGCTVQGNRGVGKCKGCAFNTLEQLQQYCLSEDRRNE